MLCKITWQISFVISFWDSYKFLVKYVILKLVKRKSQDITLLGGVYYCWLRGYLFGIYIKLLTLLKALWAIELYVLYLDRWKITEETLSNYFLNNNHVIDINLHSIDWTRKQKYNLWNWGFGKINVMKPETITADIRANV